MKNNDPQILLLYYNFKGVGQVIRHLLCYLKIPFVDILLDEYERQKLMLSPKILQILRGKYVNRSDLPAIIHNNQVIYELNQIMHYICLAYGHEELLGIDIFQKARVCEILQLYNWKQIGNIRFYTNLLDELQKRPLDGEELLAFLDLKFNTFLQESGYVKELTTYLIRQQGHKFVFGNLTIIDFYFIESSQYALWIFGNIDEKLATERWAQKSFSYRLKKLSRGQRVENLQFLRTLKKYQEFYYSQEFYRQSRVYLEAYWFFSKSLPKENLQILKNLEYVNPLDVYYKQKQ